MVNYCSYCTRSSAVKCFKYSFTSALMQTRSNMFRAFMPKVKQGEDGDKNYIKLKKDANYEMTFPPEPREERMEVDQDWTSVWPTAQVFKPSVVPLPLRMGKPSGKFGVPLSKYANVELLKINNFLHLTPPAIGKHCAAIKKFMTQWPQELNRSDARDNFFPLEITTSDFCFAGPAVGHPDSRVCTLRIKLSNLKLGERARNKMILLLNERYDPETDYLQIVTDRCPTRKQNQDYAVYLLTVLYHESKKFQTFEEEKSEADDEKFVWETSGAKESLENYMEQVNVESDDSKRKQLFKEAVQKVVDEGEDAENLIKLKSAALEVFGMKPFKIENEGEKYGRKAAGGSTP